MQGLLSPSLMCIDILNAGAGIKALNKRGSTTCTWM